MPEWVKCVLMVLTESALTAAAVSTFVYVVVNPSDAFRDLYYKMADRRDETDRRVSEQHFQEIQRFMRELTAAHEAQRRAEAERYEHRIAELEEQVSVLIETLADRREAAREGR